MPKDVDIAEDVRENEYNDAHMRIDPWFKKINDEGKVNPVDSNYADLQNIFEFKGANFEITPAQEKSLKSYSNKASREGMNAIWGKERIDAYKLFCNEWITKFETTPGNVELPKLEKSGKKDSGMMQLFHELTLFAKGDLKEEELINSIETRIKNGKKWQQGNKEERIKMPVRGENEPLRLGSIPPGFVSDFYNWLLTSR